MCAEMKDPYHTRPDDKDVPAAYAQDEVDQELAEKKKKTISGIAEAAIDILGEVVEAIIDAVT